MKRKDFLKNLTAGIAAGIIIPQTLKASPINKEGNAQVAVDINSLAIHSPLWSNPYAPKPSEFLEYYKKTGVLIYNSRYGKPPQVISGEIKVVDVKTIKG